MPDQSNTEYFAGRALDEWYMSTAAMGGKQMLGCHLASQAAHDLRQ